MAGLSSGAPAGEPYDWFIRAQELMSAGDFFAAAQLLSHAVAAEPQAASLRELHARALFDAGQFMAAHNEFKTLTTMAPDDDYARFGLGMSLWRMQMFTEAAIQLQAAVAMKPTSKSYQDALKQVQATQRAREAAGLPADGPLPPRPIEGL